MPIHHTDSTYEQIRAQAESRFKESAPAAALIYRGGDSVDFVGVRVESPELSKEFVSNVVFGRDPEGSLYYHNVLDLDGDCSFDINFQVGVVLSISFYTSNPSTPFAQFVGKDPASAIGWLNYDVYNPNLATVGTWQDYTVASVVSKIKCRTGDTLTTIDLSPIGKKVTFNLSAPAPKAINHLGTLTIKSIKSISANTHSIVDYKSDRILFYPQTGKSVMTGYFIPRINDPSDLQALSGSAFISDSASAVWSDV